jgi:restriction endonuclease S subunit
VSWNEITLGECFTIKHGFAFKGDYFAESGQYVVLTPGNFNEPGGFRVRPGKDRYYAVQPPEDFILKPGDLVIAMTEQGEGLLGSSALIPFEGSYLHNQRIGLIENLDVEKLDKLFLYHLFNTPLVRGQIRASATGGKVRHTAPKRIYAIKVQVPAVREQLKIAEMISAYDNLIENNRRRITLLEAAARTLYREWFVHFRFPGHEHVRIVGGIAYAERHDNIEAIYKKLTERRDTADVTELLKELHRIVNEAIRTQTPGRDQTEGLTFDLSQIDMVKLRDEFAKKVSRKATALQDTPSGEVQRSVYFRT